MITIANANALHIPLADKSVQCVVTSPPYWGLRDYGTAKWEGGSAECDHRIDRFGNRKITDATTIDQSKQTSLAGEFVAVGQLCPKCGARRIDAQIGLESTPAAYVAHIVAVMRECWRVLKDDGVLWLNLGDSYASQPAGNSDATFTAKQASNAGSEIRRKRSTISNGLKPKDLCGIPWRVAFALQDDGWYLRSDIIWSKPNPMPESVTDRPTKAHEYVFLLTKRERYYYDAEAIKETAQDRPLDSWEKRKEAGAGSGSLENGHNSSIAKGEGFTHNLGNGSGRNRRSVWTVATQPYSGKTDFTCPECGGTGYIGGQLAERTMSLNELESWFANDALPCEACNGSGEQSTNVDHFATFPPALIEPMILAGTSARGECPKCGKAWVRVIKKVESDDPTGYNGSKFTNGKTVATHPNTGNGKRYESSSAGWRPQCECFGHFEKRKTWVDFGAGREYKTIDEYVPDGPQPDPIPQTVLDPFAGSGTTGAVSVKHGRKAVLFDLNTKYIDLQLERTDGIQITMQM